MNLNIEKYRGKKCLKVIKFILFICMIAFIVIPNMVNADNDLPKLELKIEVPKDKLKVGEEVEIEGTITPSDVNLEPKSREVLLLLDTSGSMIEESDHDCNEPRERTLTNYYKQYYNDKWYTYRLNYNVHMDDFCKLHDKVGPHKRSKMDELKKSVTEFINKMKLVGNVKISIVSFNTTAKVESELSDDFENLKEIVNGDGERKRGLSAGGGTNIGDGMAKSVYVLNKNGEITEDLEKSMVLMTDGQPMNFVAKGLTQRYYSYYTRYYKDYKPEYDLNIDENTDEKNVITGTQEHNKEYALKIGEIIKEKDYNVYSVGYDLDKVTGIDAKGMLKDIHNSMTDKEENFYDGNQGSLEKVFKHIADKISYSLTDVKLNLDEESALELVSENDDISVDNIVYIPNEDLQSKKYSANPVKFKFKVKVKKDGHIDISKDLKLTFNWKGKKIEQAIEKKLVDIIDESKLSVKMQVYDSGGSIYYDSTKNKDDIDKQYKLYGKSSLLIEVLQNEDTVFRYKFKKDDENIKLSNWRYIYPKSDKTGLFTSTEKIDFEDEYGNYIIEYQTLRKKDTTYDESENIEILNSGSFGKFQIEQRFEIKKDVSKNKVSCGEKFDVIYTIKPKQIKTSDFYKSDYKGEFVNDIYVKEINITDRLPNNFVFAQNKANFTINPLKDIKYELKEDKYVAEEQIIKTEVICTSYSSEPVIINGGTLEYEDVSLYDKEYLVKEQDFSDKCIINIEEAKSIILNHGIFSDDKVKELTEYRFCEDMIYTMAFTVDAQGFKNDFTITVDNSKCSISDVEIFELDKDGEIDINSKKVIGHIPELSKEGNGFGKYLTSGKKYMITYNLNNKETRSKDIFIIAKLDSGAQKMVQINFGEKLPELF